MWLGNQWKRTMIVSEANHALGNLSAAEIKAIKAMRAEQETRAARSAFQQKAIATSHAFETWSAMTAEGLTFSTFVNAFGYQADDGKLMYEAIKRIQQAALPTA